jgi:hypothetical protein
VEADLLDRRGRSVRTFEGGTREEYETGYLGVALMRSMVNLSKVRIQGVFERSWLDRAKESDVPMHAGDMPGAKPE